MTNPSRAPIAQLQLTVLRRLDGLLAGDHAGLFPGHGTERGEARPYVAGDDPRHIDWSVTARTNEPHVRDTIADHELELWLVVDASSSLAFGTARATKYELAWAAAGAFALLAAKGGNRVGAVTSGRTRRVAGNWCASLEPAHAVLELVFGNGEGKMVAPCKVGLIRENQLARADLNPQFAVCDFAGQPELLAVKILLCVNVAALDFQGFDVHGRLPFRLEF